jgi:hypothetical protein
MLYIPEVDEVLVRHMDKESLGRWCQSNEYAHSICRTRRIIQFRAQHVIDTVIDGMMDNTDPVDIILPYYKQLVVDHPYLFPINVVTDVIKAENYELLFFYISFNEIGDNGELLAGGAITISEAELKNILIYYFMHFPGPIEIFGH